jgi:hypothetical protein
MLRDARPQDNGHGHGAGPIDPLNLWKAVPPVPSKYMDTEAVHATDDNCSDSFYDTDHSQLTPGFISDNDDGLVDADKMQEVVPITARRLRTAQQGIIIRPKFTVVD